jgi:hypothetical protein
MRIVLVTLALLLLLGCIQQPPAENVTPGSPAKVNTAGNSMPNVTAPQNQTPPAQNTTGNESVINESNITVQNASIPGNATIPNATNLTTPNETSSAAGQHPTLPFGDYSLVLNDVSIVPASSAPCGIFSITAANGSIMDQFVACPRQSHTWIAPDGHAYRIFVVKVAAGYGGVEWADAIVFG